MDVLMKIIPCPLYSGKPEIAEKDGKYHVIQGELAAVVVKVWYDTREEAVRRWNERVRRIA